MAIRMAGMVSGLDTDALVKELVSAYNKKTESYEKKKTKLEWKQEAWKELNTKIYDLYSKTLSSLRFSSAYNKRATTVSDETKASVTASSSAAKGTQTLEVHKMAASGYLTGSKIIGMGDVTSDTALRELGIVDETTITLQVGDGETKDIKMSGDTTIGDVIKQFKEAGVDANFDEQNGRIFLMSKGTGRDLDFKLEGDTVALHHLGLLTDSVGEKVQSTNNSKVTTATKLSDLGIDVTKKFKINSSWTMSLQKRVYDDENHNSFHWESITVGDLLYSLKLDGGVDAYFDEKNQKFVIRSGKDRVLDEEFFRTNEDVMSHLGIVPAGYGTKFASGKTPVEGKDTLSELGVTETSLKIGDSTITLSANKTVDKLISELKDAGVTVELKKDRFVVTGGMYKLSNVQDTTSINALKQLGLSNVKSGMTSGEGVKINGSDAEIKLNGATFTSTSNNFNINGLSINVKETTQTGVDEKGEPKYGEVKLVTDTDVDSIYKTIKNFITEYNAVISEMDGLYNADSAKDYEPLTDEEKEALSEKEVEKWEEKIKKSLLRRDNTLNSVASMMKTAMIKSFDVNGVKMSLSTFGIKTGNYFTSKDNEKNIFHIDGDPEDSTVSAEDDELKKAIAADPDGVADFFAQLTDNLYDELYEKMRGTTLSSAFTVYNDKQLNTEMDQYNKQISRWEDYVSQQEEFWYSKFTAMEKALSQLQSSSSALSGLLGG